MCSICHWQSSKVHMVQCKSKDADSAIADATLMQQNDEWSLEVKGRLNFVNNLCEEDAIYHEDCKSRFQSGKETWIRYWDLSRQQLMRGKRRLRRSSNIYVRMMANRLLSVN